MKYKIKLEVFVEAADFDPHFSKLYAKYLGEPTEDVTAAIAFLEAVESLADHDGEGTWQIGNEPTEEQVF